MDPDIEEIKEMSKRALALAEDTNRTVHKLRRAAWWHFIFQILWWGAILGGTAAVYHYYLEPHMQNLWGLYQQIQGTSQQAQGWEQAIADYIRTHFSNTAPYSPQVPTSTTTGQ